MFVAAVLAFLSSAAHTAVAAAVGAGGFYLANRLKLRAVLTDVVELSADFDHTPSLAEVAKTVEKIAADVVALRSAPSK
jgi:hypothetical protein